MGPLLGLGGAAPSLEARRGRRSRKNAPGLERTSRKAVLVAHDHPMSDCLPSAPERESEGPTLAREQLPQDKRALWWCPTNGGGDEEDSREESHRRAWDGAR